MKRLIACGMAAALAAGGAAKEPVDWVNCYIGSVSHMLVPTFRTVQRPNAMYRFNAPAGQVTEDRVGPLWLQNPGHRDRAVFSVRPRTGNPDDAFGGWTSLWDQSHASPHRYDVWLEEPGVRFEIAPGEKAAIARFDFERAGRHALVFGLRDGDGRYAMKNGALEGEDVFHSSRGCKARVYLRAEFDVAPSAVRTRDGKIALFFGETAETVRMRFAVSYLSHGQAARNLAAEVRDFDLAALAAGARARWNAVLGQVRVEGGTDDEKSVFYTALWRCHERMVDVTEEGRYLGFDGAAHDADGVTYYVDDWTWDTWRAAHPLMTILHPKAQGEKLQSYVRMAEQNPEKWMPVFPGIAGDRHSMVNRHTSAMFLDAWRKGIRNFDARRAFELTDHTEETESLIPWYRGPLTELDRFYKRHGYYPGLRPDQQEWVPEVDTGWERRQCVSVPQGAALDAWAIAEFGRELGIDAARLAKYDARAKGYATLWNPKTGFFHPKDHDGAFIEPFDYMICGGYGARNYYTENNAWTYIWDVQHDLPGLVKLFGGAAGMAAKLDRMLTTSVGRRFTFAAQMPDGCTGLMGCFTMANEPSFHVPYLYNIAGEPWKTQRFVRRTLDCWFRNDKMGMCGDEDGGGMSAYAVFSMMGFYPVTPGLPEYQWGSPVFRKVSIALENGRRFVIEAPEASADAKYIHAVTVNGAVRDGTAISHADIAAGGRVVVKMGARPDKSWGVRR
ncbi:MAG: GH92 family glycosyl hydrolase [Kiritimatiellia bacterium]